MMLAAAISIGLSGCALTAAQKDVGDLSTAVSQFKAAASGVGPAEAARADAAKARLIGFVARGQIPPALACRPPVEAERAFDAAVAGGDGGAAARWQALIRSRPCQWGADLEPEAPGAPPTQPIMAALEAYYGAVADIASATHVGQVVDAANRATVAATTLAGFAPGAAAPAKAASALIGKLVTYGLQEAQYRALAAVLADVDPLLDKASGPVIAALRVRQGYWISQTAFFAGDGVSALHEAISTAAPAERLALLQLSQPILDDLNVQQQRVRTDPGAAFQALVAAHHRLYAALRTGKGQVSGMLAAAQDIAGSAQSLAGAAPP